MEKETCIQNSAVFICFAVSIAFFGMYYEFCGAAGTAVLSLILILQKNRRTVFRLSLGAALYLLFLLCYVLSVFVAVDSGMAFAGVGKILWILPFLLLYQQPDRENRDRFFRGIPWIGVVLALSGLAGYFVPAIRAHTWVNGRLGGTFQYPNTMAVFLLVCAIGFLHEEKTDWKNTAGFLVLCAGIGFTGSRTVMVLSAVTLFILMIQKKRWKLAGAAAALVAVAAAYVLLSQDTSSIGRIVRISLTESTFVGRILYARDALPLLLRHPLGMGHLGYYYSENMVQTGVYTVRFVHNDWLQIGLDAGWIPMAAYPAAVIGCMISRQLSACKKWMLAVIFLHGLLDYDLAYSAVLCLVIVIMDDVQWTGKGAEMQFALKKTQLAAGAVFGILLGTYLAVPFAAEYAMAYDFAASVYPWHTEANLRRMSESEDIDEVERLAERVLKQNDTCALAYYALAYAAYWRDDYEQVISWQRQAIVRDYFNYEEYVSYAAMLYDGILYGSDEAVRSQCRAELMNIPALLEEAKGRLSALGSRILDQPELEVDERLQELLTVL